MKRYIIALASAAFVGSTVLASAAALNVTGGVAQHGEVTDLTCDDSGVQVLVRWDTDYPEAGSLGPQFIGVAPGCDGQYIVAHAYDAAGNLLSHSIPVTVDDAKVAPYFNADWENFVGLDQISEISVTIIS